MHTGPCTLILTTYENKYKAVVKTLLTRYFMLTAFIVISTGKIITASTGFSNVFISCMQDNAVAFNQSVPFGYLWLLIKL